MLMVPLLVDAGPPAADGELDRVEKSGVAPQLNPTPGYPK